MDYGIVLVFGSSFVLMWWQARRWIKHYGHRRKLPLLSLFKWGCFFAFIWTIAFFMFFNAKLNLDTLSGFLVVWAAMTFPTSEILLRFWKREKLRCA